MSKKLSTGRSRTEIIAGYSYGQARPYWALITQAERDQAVKDGDAMPDGSYPVRNCDELAKAVHAVGRGGADHDEIRRHIMAQAKKHDCGADAIPDNWKQDGSIDDDDAGAHASLANAAPPSSDAAPSADVPDQPTSDAEAASPDANVTARIADLKNALAEAQKAQAADPDPDDPNDKKVAALLEQIVPLVSQLEDAQTADNEDAASDIADATTDAPPSSPDAQVKMASAVGPPTNPVDADGNIADDHKCANPDCGHVASVHLDQAKGQNTGPCQTPGCQCAEMEVASTTGGQVTSGSDDQGNGVAAQGDPANNVTDATSSAHGGAFADGAPDGDPGASRPPAAPPGSTQPPAMEGGENVGPAFTIPIAIIEGEDTGDGRSIAPGALDWRLPPLPLMGLATSTHDPSGMDMNAPAVICGRIDAFERAPGENGTQIISAKGFYLANDDGQYFSDLNEAMGRMGISADVAVEDSLVQITEVGPDGWPMDGTDTVVKGTIQALTICPMPAFTGAYIVLGDGTTQPEAIPQATEPNPVTASVHWISYAACEPCQTGTEVIVASAGPLAPPKAWFDNPNFTEGDGRLVEILDSRGLGGKYACPLTVAEDGRVFGHLAPWGVCHIGRSGSCVTAPRSRHDYAYFLRSAHVVTAEGERVRCGTLTVDAAHASVDPRTSASAAMAHYDNTALAVADVNVGEDEYGIWVAGAVRPDATEAQVRKLRASALSGDWRPFGGGLELVAALAVNSPGFPLAMVSSGEPAALIAAGAQVMYGLTHHEAPSIEPEPVGDAALRRALSPLLHQARDHARERINALRG